MTLPFRRNKDDDRELDDVLQHVESRVEDDGRVRMSFSHRAQELFHSRDKRTATDLDDLDAKNQRHRYRPSLGRHKKDYLPVPSDFDGVPRMSIAVLITGSRGDVQPFIALGQTLRDPPYNHRVRICTHPVFKDFVEENGLEFFSIGGDPAKLMAYMVKNPGIIPSLDSIKAGDIGQRKAELAEMLEGAWRACTTAGDGITKIDLDKMAGEDVLLSLPPPFVADAIIANPPTYAHIHIAEKLGIPLHLMFTMPWSPTGEFPHPLAQMDASKVDARIANALSYKRMELLTWTGLADIVNHFREKTLMLDAVNSAWGYRLFPRLKVPFTYCWSEALIPKPADWGPHITVSGFFFLPLASSYKPSPELEAFLNAGPPPVYIGFGSIVVDDPEALTQMIFDAVKISGIRALVSKGWGNVGGSSPPQNVFLLGNVPHDWLFPRCSAVVHHGGAGTTAIGVALGKPTVIVPFFGDQPWWAGMIYRAGAGPEAVPFKKLTAEKLAENITRALEPDILAKAHELSMKIKDENGMANAARDFHSMPQMKNVACFLCPDRVAVWRVRRTNIQLSAIATGVLVGRGVLKPEQMKLVRHKRWYVEEGAQDPLIGALGAFTTSTVGVVNDVSDYRKDLSEHETRVSFETPSTGTESKHDDENCIASGALTEESSKPSDDIPRKSSDVPKSSSEQDDRKGRKAQKCTTSSGRKSAQASRSRSRAENQKKHHRVVSATGRFAESVVGHSLKFPVAVIYNVTNGLHNAPAAYLGDETVRTRDNITGLGSGLMVGGKELGFGLYDAFTGVVTQPYRGYKEGTSVGGQALGTAKGVGRGFGGLISKTGAAILGVPAYGLKGLEREVQRWYSGSDALLRGEVDIIQKAKNEVLRSGMGGESGSPAAKLMWEDAKGSGVGKRIIERRVWQGYREIRERRLENADFAKVEQEILDRWQSLKVDEKFLAGL